MRSLLLGVLITSLINSLMKWKEASHGHTMCIYAGLGPDGDVGDPRDAEDDAATPDGALRRPSDHRLRLW